MVDLLCVRCHKAISGRPAPGPAHKRICIPVPQPAKEPERPGRWRRWSSGRFCTVDVVVVSVRGEWATVVWMGVTHHVHAESVSVGAAPSLG